MILYTRHSDKNIIKKLKNILTIQKITYDKIALDRIAELSNGDMRLAITNLQLVYNKNNNITLENVNELCDLPQQVVIKELFVNLIKYDLSNSLFILQSIKLKGYSNSDILLSMIYTLKSNICNDISEHIKICIYDCVAMATYRISKGIDSSLQMTSCLVDIVKMLKEK